MTPNDVKIVAENIDDFIEVSGGVSRLRKAVLTLAVSGRLVPQDNKEGTAKEFYSQIQSDYAKKPRDRKEVKQHESISLADVPFDIPKSWEWVRGADLFSVVRGVTYGKQDAKDDASKGHVPLLRSHNIQEAGLNINDLVFVPEDKISSQQMLKKGDILIAMSSGSKNLVGKAAQAPEDMNYSYGAFCAVIRSKLPLIAPYLGFFFSTPYYRDATALEGKGMSINNLTVGALENMLIPLPPLAEQERIVRRSREVVAQLGDLDSKKRERDETRTRLARSAMQSLGKGKSKIAFEHLSELVKTSADLKELEGALLTLAISGKLVSQDKKEGTADVLYKQIQAERAKKVEGRKNKSSDNGHLEADEIPFEIPITWKWMRIREATHDCGQKTPDKDFCYVDVSSIDSSRGVIVEPKYLKASEAPSRARKRVEDGSVIYSGVRPYLLNTAIVDFSAIDKEIIVSTAFFVLKPYANISSEYVHLVVRSSYFDDMANRACVGVAYPAINDNKFEKLPIPLPPLAEQKRIVKKVEEIMVLINNLHEVVGESRIQTRGRPKK